MSIVVVGALALMGLAPSPLQSGTAPYANWREAAPCVSVFDTAANRAYLLRQRDPEVGGAAFNTWDAASSALIDSMNQRLTLAQSEQADRIRRETDASLSSLADDAVFARAEDCKSRLPDPIRLP